MSDVIGAVVMVAFVGSVVAWLVGCGFTAREVARDAKRHRHIRFLETRAMRASDNAAVVRAKADAIDDGSLKDYLLRVLPYIGCPAEALMIINNLSSWSRPRST
jgi:hypothetical protein